MKSAEANARADRDGLTDAQWRRVLPLLPSGRRPPGRAGRPRVDNRIVLGGILWVLREGAPWKRLPERYGSYQTCHRRYQEWSRSGVLGAVLEALLDELERDGGLAPATDGGGLIAPAVEDLARRGAAFGERSWQARTARLFLSPYAREALRLSHERAAERRAGTERTLPRDPP